MKYAVLIFAILSLTFTRIITVVIHEMGHGIAGLILLKGQIEIYIGSYGDPNKGIHFKIGRLTIHFKYNPLLWHSGMCVSAGDASFVRRCLVTLAGPLASLIMILVCIYIISSDMHGIFKLISFFLCFSSLQDLFLNLVPSRTPILLHDGAEINNDGKSLKMLMKYRGIYDELIILNQYYNNNETDKGIEFFNKLGKKKKHVDIQRIGIGLYIKNHQYSKAIEMCNELEGNISLNSDDYCNYALAFTQSGEHTRAVELYNKSLQLNPNNFYSLNNKGYTLNMIGQYIEAITDFDKALEVNSNFAYAYNNRGLAKLMLGNEEQGLADINKSLELNDKNAYAYMNLGIYHKMKGELEKSLELFSVAKSYDERTHGLEKLSAEVENKVKVSKHNGYDATSKLEKMDKDDV